MLFFFELWIVNFMASGLKHYSNLIVYKLLHNTQVTYKARGPLVLLTIDYNLHSKMPEMW